MKRIFAVIVTFNSMNWIDKCLDSLRNSSNPLLPIIIDNCSTDGTVEFIKQNYQEVKLIENNKNLGFGKANNIGLKYAIESNTDYVFLLNQDAWIDVNTLDVLIRINYENPQLGIISPIQLNGMGTELDKNFSNYIPFKTISEVNKAKGLNKSCIETNFVNAAAWLLSKECILKVGGFDPLFSHYGEDRDYCYRAKYHGYKIGIALNTSICHDRMYRKDNMFRKNQLMLYTAGLASIKNINHPLWKNYINWLIYRARKIIKALLLFDYKGIYSEFKVSSKLIHIRKKIIENRKLCKDPSSTFLN